MSGATRNKLGAVDAVVLVVLAFVVAADRDERLAARRARRPHREQPLHARRRHASRPRRHRRADQPLSLLLGRGDGRRSRRCARMRRRVREMLEEFAANAPTASSSSNVVDPLPFSEEEDRAEQFGLQGVHGRRGGEPVYFGLAGTNSVGTTDSDPVLPARRARSRSSSTTSPSSSTTSRTRSKTVVGLLSSAPIGGGFDPQTQQPSQPWVVVEQAKQLFEVRTLPGERARDRRRRRRALDRASEDARRRRRSTPSTSS